MPAALSALQHFLDDRGELLQRERLRQEAELGVLRQVLGERILGITRDEDELDVGRSLRSSASRVGPSISGITTSETTMSTLPSSCS